MTKISETRNYTSIKKKSQKLFERIWHSLEQQYFKCNLVSSLVKWPRNGNNLDAGQELG